MLFLLQPDYMKLLFQETIGIVAVVGGGILSVVGWFWLARIVKIEV
jgi:Flp pilus assembly protein TadB